MPIPLIIKSAPIYSIEISKEEQDQASRARTEFKHLIEYLEVAFENLHILDDALEGITDSSPFITLGKLFQQYRRKTQKLFNAFINQLEKALLELNKTVSDTEMSKIKDSIVGEVREIRDGVIELLEVLEHPQEKSFVKNFKDIIGRIGPRSDALREVITDQLFSHIDKDVLGKVRLGQEIPLSITKRGFYGI